MYCIYRVTKLWKILIIAVDADYARRGIATALLNRSLDLARELHIPLAVSNFSSLFTQRIAIRLGFETVYEGVYSENYALYHQIPESIRNILSGDGKAFGERLNTKLLFSLTLLIHGV